MTTPLLNMSAANYPHIIAPLLSLGERQVAATIELLDEKATIPFIARYRKEKTGSLDEVQIAAIEAEYKRLLDLTDRKETILKTIDDQGKLTDELKKRIEACWNSTELEDIYLPYKPHRKTRADIRRRRTTRTIFIYPNRSNGSPRIVCWRYVVPSRRDSYA